MNSKEIQLTEDGVSVIPEITVLVHVSSHRFTIAIFDPNNPYWARQHASIYNCTIIYMYNIAQIMYNMSQLIKRSP